MKILGVGADAGRVRRPAAAQRHGRARAVRAAQRRPGEVRGRDRRARRVVRRLRVPRRGAQGARRSCAGHDVFDLPGLQRLVAQASSGTVFADAHGLTGGFSIRKTVASVYSLFEVACLDAQGQYLGRPVTDLLGGKARDAVDFSAYLFYKYGTHVDGREDSWGEMHHAGNPGGLGEADDRRVRLPFDQAQGRRLRARRRRSTAIRALAEAFPGHPLRIDPNARVDSCDRHPGRARTRRRPGVPGGPDAGHRGHGARSPREARCRWPPTCAWSNFGDIGPAFRARADRRRAVGPPLLGRPARHAVAVGDVRDASASACRCTPTATSGSASPRWSTSPRRPRT